MTTATLPTTATPQPAIHYASDDIEVAPATAPAGASSAIVGVGTIVHYVLCGEAASIGQHRPAVVVRLRAAGLVDLQVITAGAEDGERYAQGYCLVCNVAQDEDAKEPGTWHWPETETGK